MAIPQKVKSSPGYIFRQPRGYLKTLTHPESCHPAPHRNGAPKHDRMETTDEIHSRRPYLREPHQALTGKRFTDGERGRG